MGRGTAAPWAKRVGDHLPRAWGAIARWCPQDKADFKDKLSPIVTSLSLALASSPGAQGLGLVLYGDTLVQAQVGPGGDTAGDSHQQPPGRAQPRCQAGAVLCSGPTAPTLSLCLSLGHGPVLSTSLGCPHCHPCCPQCLPEMSSLSPLWSPVPAQDVPSVPPTVPAPT